MTAADPLGTWPGDISLGWQYTLVHADAGPAPRRPVPPGRASVDQGWLAAQRREEQRLGRVPSAGAVCAGGVCALAVAAWTAGWLPLGLAVSLAVISGGAAVAAGRLAWMGRRDLRRRIVAETRRVAALSAVREAAHYGSQAEHAQRFRAWQARHDAFRRQPQWYAVRLPDEVDRLDVVGGTRAGWSALLTTIAAPRLAAGGEVTVIDLSDAAVAHDLVSLAPDLAVDPLVWVLPADLGRFDLGVGLPPDELADVLGVCAASGAAPGAGGAVSGAGDDVARDHALLGRVCGVFGDGVEVAQVTSALRVLGQVGDPREDVRRGLLTHAQLERLSGLFGRGAAERVVIERAWVLEARLRVLETLGADPAELPRSRLRVVSVDGRGETFGAGVAGTYAVVSLAHLLRRARPGRPWRHTLCVAGAERLHGDALDRLTRACEASRTGLVLAFATVHAHVKERLGRGNAALAVMRLGNADDAKSVSEQIGSEHRFLVSQFTETVGASVTDTVGDSYTSTVGTAGSWSGSESVSRTSGRSTGQGRSRADAAPFGAGTGSRSRDTSESQGTTGSESLTAGINASTSWGLTTSRAFGVNDSIAGTIQRSRELVVEPDVLQHLPTSGVVVSFTAAGRRTVVFADANPAIMTLPSATSLTPDKAGRVDTSVPAVPAQAADSAKAASPAAPGVSASPGVTTAWAGRSSSPAPQTPPIPPHRRPVSWRDRETYPPDLGPPEALDRRRRRRP